MRETPLRSYLVEVGSTAEKFAADHGLSPWSVRHWARGNKMPSLEAQRELDRATDGKVSPASWLAWNLSRRGEQSVAA